MNNSNNKGNIMNIREQKELLKGMLLGVRSQSAPQGLRFAAQSLASDGASARALESLASALERGLSWSQGIGEAQGVPDALAAAVKAGEETGDMKSAMETMTANMCAQEKVESRFRSAMAYPRMVGSIFFVLIPLIVFLLRNVCTDFSLLMDGMSTSRNPLSKLAFMVADLPTWAVVLFALGCVTMLVVINTESVLASRIGSLLRLLPGFRRVERSQKLSFLSANLSLLISSGVPFNLALSACRAGMADSPFSRELEQALRRADVGDMPWECLSSADLYPRAIGWYLMEGGQQGLADSFSDLADYYAEDMETVSSSLAPLLEASLIGILGILVGGVVVSIFLPMMRLVNGV